jgi:hypothetical protein
MLDQSIVDLDQCHLCRGSAYIGDGLAGALSERWSTI